MTRKLYGWNVGDDWFLSLFKREDGKPSNKYDSKNDAIREAEARGLSIQWLP